MDDGTTRRDGHLDSEHCLLEPIGPQTIQVRDVAKRAKVRLVYLRLLFKTRWVGPAGTPPGSRFLYIRNVLNFREIATISII